MMQVAINKILYKIHLCLLIDRKKLDSIKCNKIPLGKAQILFIFNTDLKGVFNT